MFDLVIRNGTVVDGTGAKGRVADVGISGRRVVEMGEVDGPARRTVDADGLIVAPGFVDIHTHYDPHVLWDPYVTPSSLHGVTTVVNGNCGFSLAPLDEAAAEYLVPMLARVEGMPLESLEQIIDLRWSSFGEWLDLLEDTVAINVGFLAGHTTIRRVVMQEDAVGRAATDDEVASMGALLRQSLGEGALGFSSSWGESHSDHFGDPVPSRSASGEELLALCECVAGFEGTTLEFIPPKAEFFDDRICTLLTDMSLAAQRPLNWNLLRVRAEERSLRSYESRLGASDHAASAGARVVPLTLPEPLRMMVSFATGPYELLPNWGEVMRLPLPKRVRAFARPDVRMRLAAGTAGQPYSMWTDWPGLRVASVDSPRLAAAVGSTIGEIAGASGKDTFDELLDLVVADGGKMVFEAPVIDDDDAFWELRARVMRDPRVVVGGSDAGAHIDSLMTFAFHTRLLAQSVRERQLVSLEEAIHLVTDVPARLYGLRERGRLSEGWRADIVVFDPSSVGPGENEVRHDMPAGGTRLFSRPTGVVHVFANGIEVAAGGESTGELGGDVLRSGRDTETVYVGRSADA